MHITYIYIYTCRIPSTMSSTPIGRRARSNSIPRFFSQSAVALTSGFGAPSPYIERFEYFIQIYKLSVTYQRRVVDGQVSLCVSFLSFQLCLDSRATRNAKKQHPRNSVEGGQGA